MIPLRDNIVSRTTPWVNYAMIGLCALAFLAQLQETDPRQPSLVEKYGMIPARVLHPERPVLIDIVVPVGGFALEGQRPAAAPPFSPWWTLLTCVFLHGGWMHFLGNVWFLYIFGDNVEDRFGHGGYLAFYLFCGAAASAAHLTANPASDVPTIGASGAIAGVMGAYFLLYPRALVLSLVPLFVFVQIVVLPAPWFLGIWFMLQLFQGTMSISNLQAGGVAWWAHIGGFAVGAGVAYLMDHSGLARPPVQQLRPRAERSGVYRLTRHAVAEE